MLTGSVSNLLQEEGEMKKSFERLATRQPADVAAAEMAALNAALEMAVSELDELTASWSD
ncbi:hypothetical protein [Candidatus Electronema sp. PJ]|uniref:hypothetical protein n=1 Tax=Candidatus Electronema sp. PJ TaxID=3401572 RepID=UPI003AA80E9D